ncbi:trna (adenine-n-)-methyltransferase non-catalytic subunit [Plasmopara halstedii]|uniref:tRNA (adenine(58)-N(1))-methyltransferase non-catalytic subunit TRM6 n=1 Tax=Plasmopara halstedii TaxID=4781 RepID=A0A0P1AWZ4_PLAHL|nr:trna (adenine-n-)-methyltransferase non-catalytic subunit [Plasmopara halstedii]CEG46927.1 trna (adenine-n-)-methyltransferase non-catalytic subunit [Plasmopara halstedii]|eukprot:XP_024583296.1 trna (adenine-n-)-methyltransferase non-catalytic subunit [Plasmopara halstedii]
MALAGGADASTSTEMSPRLPHIIYEGDTVICQTSDGRMFFQAITKNESIRVGKKVASLKPVVGSFYGAIFEEQNKKLVKVTGGLFPDPVAPETGEGLNPDEDNRHFADTNSAQMLKQTDIGELRDKGASGKEIIQKLVENSSTWETKTDFSKQKYLKKKQQKYMPRVRFLRCTAESLCRTYRLKNPMKICNMREDSLGQILVYANIFAGGQVLVVDTCMGLVAGAIAERQRGTGCIICPYEGQQPAADILRRFNFDKQTLESIHYMPFNQVRMLEMNEEDVVEIKQVARDGLSQEERERMAAERAKNFTPEQQKRFAEKKALREQTKLFRQKPSTIREWVRQKSDSLVIAANYDPEKVLMALLPYLGRSKPFVIYSEFLEPLTRTFATLQKLEAIIDLQLNETWTRENQVLPGRTHPEMSMSACSGYLLSGIKILDISPLKATVNGIEIEQDSSSKDFSNGPASKRAKTETKK